MNMNYKELKEGSFIKWDADRMFKSWSTFGKVISIHGGNVKIICYDDFKVSEISLKGESVKDEITLCDKNDVLDYLQLRSVKLIMKKSELEIEYNKSVREIEHKISLMQKTANELNTPLQNLVKQ